MKVNLLELFSGIGGFAKGLTDAGFEIETHLFSEIDKHAIANYQYNFKNAKSIGSVTDVRGEGLKRPDIITFGSPCQDFSLAGKRAGIEGQRSSLILEAIRLIGELRPGLFIWENVKGAFSSNAGADFWAIIAAFANIGGYRLEWQLVNTSWVLPQNRERIYLVGHLDGFSTPSVFPFRASDFGIDEGIPETATVRTLSAGGHSGGHHSGMTLIQRPHGGFNGNENMDICPTISISSFQDNVHVKIKSNTKNGFETAKIGDGINLGMPNSKTRRGRVGKGVAQTLDTQGNQGVLVGYASRTDGAKEIRRISMKSGVDFTPFQGKKMEFKPSDVMNTVTCATQKDNLIFTSNIRRLTEIECERLQGFPDDWTKWGNYDGKIKEIPKTQRYKLIGNAVTTNIVKLIGERLLNKSQKKHEKWTTS